MDLICAAGFFKNPDKLPLNKVYLEYKQKTRTAKGSETLENLDKMLTQSSSSKFDECFRTEIIKKPALDQYWIEEKVYNSFIPYYINFDEIHNTQFLQNHKFLQQLQFLIDCTYQQFWCYIRFDSNIATLIKHFLHSAYPPHIITDLPKNYLDLYNEIHSSVILILCRLLNFNASETEYLNDDVVQEILQDTELFRVENVCNMCYLYNFSDPKLTKQILDFCFSIKNDAFIKSIGPFLDKLSLELEYYVNFVKPFTSDMLEEKTVLLFEVASALRHFLSACTQAIEIGYSMTDLPLNITSVYQKVDIEAREVLDATDYVKKKALFKEWIACGKYELVNVYHCFTSHCINSIVKLRDNHLGQQFFVEMYISLISNALDHDLFIIAYNKTYCIRDQFQTLVDCVTNFDIQQTDYLLQSLDSIINECDSVPEEVTQSTSSTPLVAENNQAYLARCDEIKNTLSQFLERCGNKKTAALPKSVSVVLEEYYDLVKELEIANSEHFEDTEKEMSENVKAVMDVLPDLNKNFVLKSLEKFNNNPNEVIAHILSGDLPSDLSNLRDDPYSNQPTSSKSSMRELIGKKQSSLNMDILDDTKEKEKIKQFVLKASYTLDLDDEYDDRVVIGKSLNDSDDESRILRHLGEENDESDESESSSETEKDTRKNTRDFCVDPALLREQRAQQRQNVKYVKQNKDVDQNDTKKRVKSGKPKHNKKGEAHWKRNKGMIPS